MRITGSTEHARGLIYACLKIAVRLGSGQRRTDGVRLFATGLLEACVSEDERVARRSGIGCVSRSFFEQFNCNCVCVDGIVNFLDYAE